MKKSELVKENNILTSLNTHWVSVAEEQRLEIIKLKKQIEYLYEVINKHIENYISITNENRKLKIEKTKKELKELIIDNTEPYSKALMVDLIQENKELKQRNSTQEQTIKELMSELQSNTSHAGNFNSWTIKQIRSRDQDIKDRDNEIDYLKTENLELKKMYEQSEMKLTELKHRYEIVSHKGWEAAKADIEEKKQTKKRWRIF